MTKLHAPQPIFMKRKTLCALLPWSVSLSNCRIRLYLRSKDTLALRLQDALVSYCATERYVLSDPSCFFLRVLGSYIPPVPSGIRGSLIPDS